MFSIIVKTLFSIAVLFAMYYGLQSFGGVSAISSQVAHFQAAFNFLVLNIKNLATVFPWVIDSVALFTAIIAIEFLVVAWKIWNFIHKKTNNLS